MEKLISSTEQHIQGILGEDCIDIENSQILINLTIVLRNLIECSLPKKASLTDILGSARAASVFRTNQDQL